MGVRGVHGGAMGSGGIQGKCGGGGGEGGGGNKWPGLQTCKWALCVGPLCAPHTVLMLIKF